MYRVEYPGQLMPSERDSDDCATPFYEMGYTGLASHGQDVGSMPVHGSSSRRIQGPVAAGLLATQQRPGLGLLGLNDPIACRRQGAILEPSFVSTIAKETWKMSLTQVWSYTAGRYNGWCPFELMMNIVTS